MVSTTSNVPPSTDNEQPGAAAVACRTRNRLNGPEHPGFYASAVRSVKIMSIDQVETQQDLDASTWDALEVLGRAFHVEDSDPQSMLAAILRAAIVTVEGTDFAGINLLVKDKLVPQAVCGEPPNELDALQVRTGIGPCVDAARSQSVIRVDDLGNAENWPEYGRLAVSLGVRSMLCAPMRVDDLELGSISVYSRSLAAYGAVAERVAGLLGLHAAVALADARRRENLSIALHNRDVIGQAKGILMERRRITAEAAFELLSKTSQRRNRKLAAIAEEVASTGVLEEGNGA